MRSILSIVIGLAVWCGVVGFSAYSLAAERLPAPPAATTAADGGWPDSDSHVSMNPIDRAYLAAAKSRLKQAEFAQEIYVLDNNCYASDLDQLRTEDPALPDSVQVVRSSCSGYLIRSQAHDSGATIVSLKKENGAGQYHAVQTAPAG
ncbi:MAG: hypothetical protein M0Z32_08470 [Actinomycetota bacterium]|jgi:hypothetical protein|nr:hypothetical protein [Actinomycetota bacterium]MCL6093824.1 hypothetical protein [Actinomycetota bacterium]MDA8167760.1 hypothetical protein [Actinomycetota bacterium]